MVEHLIAKEDRLKILEADIVLIDYDSSPGLHVLALATVNPSSRIVVVSRICPLIDSYFSEKIMAIVKPCLVIPVIMSMISEGKSDPTPAPGSYPTHDGDPEPVPEF